MRPAFLPDDLGSMKIHVLSDLHTEFAPFHPPAVDAGVVVLAGDTGRRARGVALAREWFPERPVVYVAGNHEYYGDTIERLDERLDEAAAGSRVHVLRDRAVVIGGTRFLGCTLWTDFDVFGARARCMDAARAVMNDFRLIRVLPAYRRFRPADARRIHNRSVAWLNDALDAPFDGPTVVVTHHAPSLRSVAPAFRDNDVTAAYASDLEWMLDGRATLWVHGHLHHCVDYVVGGTRVVANQRGYPDDRVPGFEPARVVEVG